uniref:Uncharacterized protein LOC101242745 n=1 Tax=Phallusia mammillata TaxID=59560 RepID=A0A6F9DI11_9ASCI|nr:uncharacterized protein LOC101242745 [Phallusia mammillata]
MDPVPRIVKIGFHMYGFGSLILGLLTAVYTFQAAGCEESTTELYYWCLISSYLALICTGYFFLIIPFWLLNTVKPSSVLDWRKRAGLCYEPVACCSCIWHI